MNTNMFQICCKNNNKILNINAGTTLYEAFKMLNFDMEYGPISARMNNKSVGLDIPVFRPCTVEYLDMHNGSARRTYIRTLFCVLCKAVNDLYPNSKVKISFPVSNGYYCEVNIGREITDEDAAKILKRMQEIKEAAIPVVHHEILTSELIKMFEEKGEMSKVKLLKTTGQLYSVYYDIDGYIDDFYGSLLENTSQLYLFNVVRYYEGLLLQVPMQNDPSKLGPMIHQDKMFNMFKLYHTRQERVHIDTVGDFNEVVDKGGITQLVNVSEALQEREISNIAEEIERRGDVRVVLISGPSSSGKTTTSKRLSVQLMASGINPITISLDDYFVDREHTPRDENGEYDYEHLHALNIPLLNQHLKDLFEGKEVQLPKYNFQTGKSVNGRKLQLKPSQILIMEGIHALNPELTAQIPDNKKFKIYASALTSILLDDHNYIPTTDNRLLRRIVRDNKYRGTSAKDTISRWPSVRAGEDKWIFPFQEEADVMFNTAMIYEFSVLRQQAVTVLEQVPQNCEEYSEAYRLLKFLRNFRSIPSRDLPPTSLLREFLGGSSFKY